MSKFSLVDKTDGEYKFKVLEATLEDTPENERRCVHAMYILEGQPGDREEKLSRMDKWILGFLGIIIIMGLVYGGIALSKMYNG
jgi:hypothetical protein